MRSSARLDVLQKSPRPFRCAGLMCGPKRYWEVLIVSIARKASTEAAAIAEKIQAVIWDLCWRPPLPKKEINKTL